MTLPCSNCRSPDHDMCARDRCGLHEGCIVDHDGICDRERAVHVEIKSWPAESASMLRERRRRARDGGDESGGAP